MDAKEARELANKNGFDEKVQKEIESLNRSIKRACEYGQTSTCAFAHYNDSDKSDVDREVKKHFLKLGYTFKKTGMCGGVPQRTEDICW